MNAHAILLAGGRGSRLGGVDKPLLDIDGETLLDTAIAAVRDAGAITVVGVGPDRGRGLRWVREDPPFAGPAAALVAGVSALDGRSADAAGTPSRAERTGAHAGGTDAASEVAAESARSADAAGSGTAEWTFVLACDQPRVRQAVAFLTQAIALVPDNTDGVCLADASSRPQWLTGVYRTRALRAAASALADGGRNAPVRDVMADLAIAALADPGDLADDIDTWDDAHRYGIDPAERPHRARS